MSQEQERKFLEMIIADVRLSEVVRAKAKLKLERMERYGLV
jgi:hypothetical protein